MAAFKRLIITLPTEMANLVRGVIDEGDYASTSEVIREALHDWKMKRELRFGQLTELRAEIDHRMPDVTECRVHTFDAKRIIARGRQLLEDR